MRKRIYCFVTMLCLFTLLFPSVVMAEDWVEKTNVPTNKVWTVSFNKAVDLNTTNNIYVSTDSNGTIIVPNVTVTPKPSSSNKVLLVTGSWEPGKSYYLFVTNKVKDTSGSSLSKIIRMKFSVIYEQPKTVQEAQQRILGHWVLSGGTKTYDFFNDGTVIVNIDSTGKYGVRQTGTYSFSSPTRFLTVVKWNITTTTFYNTYQVNFGTNSFTLSSTSLTADEKYLLAE